MRKRDKHLLRGPQGSALSVIGLGRNASSAGCWKSAPAPGRSRRRTFANRDHRQPKWRLVAWVGQRTTLRALPAPVSTCFLHVPSARFPVGTIRTRTSMGRACTQWAVGQVSKDASGPQEEVEEKLKAMCGRTLFEIDFCLAPSRPQASERQHLKGFPDSSLKCHMGWTASCSAGTVHRNGSRTS